MRMRDKANPSISLENNAPFKESTNEVSGIEECKPG
jgi:hypothetical protein